MHGDSYDHRGGDWRSLSPRRIRASPGSNCGSTASELGSAVDGADIIIVVTGGNAQAVVARSLASLLRDGQVILLIQGNTGGSLIVRRTLDDAGCRADVDVAEMDNYPYSCRRLSPTRIRPIVRKRWPADRDIPGKSQSERSYRRLTNLGSVSGRLTSV
jgi:hypothetical protein